MESKPPAETSSSISIHEFIDRTSLYVVSGWVSKDSGRILAKNAFGTHLLTPRKNQESLFEKKESDPFLRCVGEKETKMSLSATLLW